MKRFFEKKQPEAKSVPLLDHQKGLLAILTFFFATLSLQVAIKADDIFSEPFQNLSQCFP